MYEPPDYSSIKTPKSALASPGLKSGSLSYEAAIAVASEEILEPYGPIISTTGHLYGGSVSPPTSPLGYREDTLSGDSEVAATTVMGGRVGAGMSAFGITDKHAVLFAEWDAMIEEEAAQRQAQGLPALAEAVHRNGVDALKEQSSVSAIPLLAPEDHFSVFSIIAMNQLKLRQEAFLRKARNELVDSLTSRLDSIAKWDLEKSWTSAEVRDRMLRSGLDTFVSVTGGQAFFMLLGNALRMRLEVASDAANAADRDNIVYVFSASTADMAIVHEKAGLGLPRFSQEHTPLMLEVVNSKTPVVYTRMEMIELAMQGRMKVPEGHVEMESVCLISLGTRHDGVLLGMCNGTYPEEIVPIIFQLAGRFIDSISARYLRVLDEEKRTHLAEQQARLSATKDMLMQLLSSITTRASSNEEARRMLVDCVAKAFSCDCAFVPITLSTTDKEEGGGSLAGFAASRIMSRGNLLPALHGQSPERTAKVSIAASSSSSRRLRVKDLKQGQTVWSSADASKRSMLGPLFDPSVPPDSWKILMSTSRGQTKVVSETDWVYDNFGTLPDFIFGRTDRFAFVPLTVDDAPSGILALTGHAELLTEAAVQMLQTSLEEFLRKIKHTSAIRLSFAENIPKMLVEKVQARLSSLQEEMSKISDTTEKLRRSKMPLWSQRASHEQPLYLLQCTVVTSDALISMAPEDKQALYQELWDSITAAATLLSDDIWFIKTVSDSCMFISGVQGINARGDAYIKLTRLAFLVHQIADKVTIGPKIQFKIGLVAATEGNQLLAFVSRTAGQMRFDYMGSFGDLVARVSSAAAPGSGCLCLQTDVRRLLSENPEYTAHVISGQTKGYTFKGFAEMIQCTMVSPKSLADRGRPQALASSVPQTAPVFAAPPSAAPPSAPGPGPVFAPGPGAGPVFAPGPGPVFAPGPGPVFAPVPAVASNPHHIPFPQASGAAPLGTSAPSPVPPGMPPPMT